MKNRCRPIAFIELKRTLYGGQQALLSRCVAMDTAEIPYEIIHPFNESMFVDEFRRLGLKGRLRTPSVALVTRLGVARVLFVVATLVLMRFGKRPMALHVEGFDSLYVAGTLRIAKLLPVSRLVMTARSERYLRLNWLDKLMLRQVDLLATNSEFSARMLAESLGIRQSEIEVAYSPIDFDLLDRAMPSPPASHRAPAGREMFRLGFVASLEPRKRVDLFARCVKAVQDVSVGLDVCGEVFGSDKSAADQNNGENQVLPGEIPGYHGLLTFHGQMPLHHIASNVDAVLFPFEDEPFGRVVAEFVYLGIPTYARNSGGMPEAACGGAVLIDGSGDEEFIRQFVAQFSSRIPHTYRDPSSPARLAIREKFSSESILERELKFYESPSPPESSRRMASKLARLAGIRLRGPSKDCDSQ